MHTLDAVNETLIAQINKSIINATHILNLMGFATFKQIKVFVLIFGLIFFTYLHENQI